jgi:SAM-dependent methyltransferase
MGSFKGFVPLRVKHELKRWLMGEEAVRYGVITRTHTPWPGRLQQAAYALDRDAFVSPPHAGGLPLPPPELRMGYDPDGTGYLSSGEWVAKALRAILYENQVELRDGDRILDWGCASGRVLRHFVEDADRMEFWGADQEEQLILWAKANLCPPFKFLMATEHPHLPFEDNTFRLIYGISVFTHLEFLIDQWLMEMRRILQPGGVAVFTVHDEASLQYFREKGLPPAMKGRLDLDEALHHDAWILTGESWANGLPFFRSDYIRREWSTYLEVVEIRPAFIDYGQSAVVLRKS